MINNERDAVIVDVVRTTINALTKGTPGERYVVGSENMTFQGSGVDSGLDTSSVGIGFWDGGPTQTRITVRNIGSSSTTSTVSLPRTIVAATFATGSATSACDRGR